MSGTPSAASLCALIVEDDPKIRDVLEFALQAEGWRVESLSRGREAIARCKTSEPDLMVLDVGLPDVDGFEVCRQVRQFSAVPVIFLTSRGDEINRVVGLEIGGDDYVVKPFSPRELVARIKAVRRRFEKITAPAEAGSVMVYGPVRLDATRFSVTYDAAALTLTKQEFRLLETLLSQPGRVFTREQLLDKAWPEGGLVADRTIDAHIKTLRKKFGGFDFIETLRGLGYRVRER